ncbi:Coenzyme F420 hydrogenase/dehydrogenase, beta subunit C-terminal domain [Halomonas sp. M4R5S39]|uniref:Coenzyme F420 hydrogenase/dehydrogenase, beta subunit C-terminal domain n=1 Tax=Halomonas kalidii TaxID=3043293 RepID=UPI0024A8BEE9|nr:Coenzyme F420 hydrogenase/dehydrogenase, beta subunit C-terminal domain [Halomonas kalidii]MDI5985661.1 Coenzyme F420 hydrogenase/dehydrogenase, beta subunit C-terminal domain [Halomonas kalidii]
MLGNIVDRLVKKEWTDDDVKQYVGDYQSAYLTYANNPETRSVAASGGTTSALLINGLENGDYEGVVVCNTVIVDGKVRPKFIIATTPEEILAARGSKYVETPFLREVLPLIRGFQGRVAVVGLPCDLSGLKRRAAKDPEFGNKIALTVALVCGHNSRHALIDETTKRLEREAGKKLADYRFRVGHWRGQLEAEFEDGSVISKPTKYFNDYQNLFFFSERKCMACHDHYGYDADITVGDVWLFRLKRNPIKHTGVITRTDKGHTFYEKVSRNNIIASDKLDVKDIMDGQSRIGPSHYNTSARSKVSRFFKIKLKDTVGEKVSWHSYLNAYITLANMRLSEKEWGRKLIFKTPRPVLKFYLYFKKGLETLR